MKDQFYKKLHIEYFVGTFWILINDIYHMLINETKMNIPLRVKRLLNFTWERKENEGRVGVSKIEGGRFLVESTTTTF